MYEVLFSRWLAVCLGKHLFRCQVFLDCLTGPVGRVLGRWRGWGGGGVLRWLIMFSAG
jgi:hypothetical protein